MPNYTPPFTVYWSTFYTAPQTQSIDTQHQFDNVEAIYNIIRNSALTITDYAIYGIIAASWAVAGLNPARKRTDYFIIDPDIPTFANGYGLWMDETPDPDNAGYRETEQMINNISNGRHYHQYIDTITQPPIVTPSLSEYLASNNDTTLAWYWVLNYVHYSTIKTEYILSDEYQAFCADSYYAVRQYITTTPRKLNPAFIALIKKRKKRWWM